MQAPRSFEIGTGLVKRRGRTARMIFDVAAGMEAATPAPLVDALWHAGALADPANLHVAKVDAPAFLMAVLFAAAS